VTLEKVDARQLATLEECRRRIDELDAELVALLNERARVSEQVGRLKAAGGSAVFAPAREARVIENVQAANQGPLSNSALRSIWIEIMSSSSALQRALRIGYLGPAGSFSNDAALNYEAAIRRFGRAAELVPAATFAEIFEMKARDEIDYAVVPVENSIDGGVTAVLDAFIDMPLQVCAEIVQPIRLHLASSGTLETIEKVYCQRVALGQCRQWLARNLPNAEIVEAPSTARAVEMATGLKEAGVGPESAIELYGRTIVVRNIQDYANNTTRFLVVGDHIAQPTGRDKTGIVFAVRHRPGALHDALRILSDAGLNLTRIESRPSKRQTWEYVFFVDFLGHQNDRPVAEALGRLREEALFVKVLGSWPEERPLPDPVSAG
jgi:chorismate mutase/prephenate dehydratase